MAAQLAAKAAVKQKLGKLTETFKPEPAQADAVDETFEDINATPFESAPSNYPPLVNLCYINRDILSSQARIVVDKARGVYLLTSVASTLNFAGHLARQKWIYAVVSLLSFVVMHFTELGLFEYAFRACYKTSRTMQRVYLFAATLNAGVLTLFAVLQVSWFNGWLSIGADVRFPIRILSAVESVVWTMNVFLQLHAIFAMMELRASHALGLAPDAIPPAARQDIESPQHNARQARRDEIRARYAQEGRQ